LHRGCRYGDSGAGVAAAAVAAVVAVASAVAATGRAGLETDESTREEVRRAKVPHKSPRGLRWSRTLVAITDITSSN